MVYVVVIDVLRCRHAYFAPSLSPEYQRLTLWLFKRGPFASQKESFWLAKRVLLECKRTTFFRVAKSSWFSAIIDKQRYYKKVEYRRMK